MKNTHTHWIWTILIIVAVYFLARALGKNIAAPRPASCRELWELLEAFDGEEGSVNYYSSSLTDLDQYFEEKGLHSDGILYGEASQGICAYTKGEKGYINFSENNLKIRTLSICAQGYAPSFKDVKEIDRLLPDKGIWKEISFGMKKSELYDALNLTERIRQTALTSSESGRRSGIVHEWYDEDGKDYIIRLQTNASLSSSGNDETLTIEKNALEKVYTFDFNENGLLHNVNIHISPKSQGG